MTDEKTAYRQVEIDAGVPPSESAIPPKPGDPPPPYYPPVGQAVIIRNGQIQPQDYLGFAICVTICSCLSFFPCVVPCGIVGIVKAVEVRSRFRQGDHQGAENASQAAKKWSTIGMVVALTAYSVYLFLYVLLYVIFVDI